MRITQRVRKILDHYESDNPGTKANLARILMQGKLGGSGKLVILPVDQGFEHGPARSFAPNPAGYDPHYHFQLAIDAGLSAYASAAGHDRGGCGHLRRCQIPTDPQGQQRQHAGPQQGPGRAPAAVKDALRLGCAAIGFTIYPGSGRTSSRCMEEIREMAEEAKAAGLAVVMPGPILARPGDLDQAKVRRPMDVCAYAAHMAALLGAHIIKVKPPTAALYQDAAPRRFTRRRRSTSPPWRLRIKHVTAVRASPASRIVVFSGRREHKDRGRPVQRDQGRDLRGRRQRQRSSAATPFNAHVSRRWRCWARSSRSTRARLDRAKRHDRAGQGLIDGGGVPPLCHHAPRHPA